MKLIRLVPILLTGVHRHKFVDNGAGSHTCSVCGGVFAHTFVVSPAGDRCRLCSGCGAAVAHSWQNGACTVCGQGHSPHNWAQRSEAHYCTVCGAAVAHSWQNGVCAVCGYACTHPSYTQHDLAHQCNVCGLIEEHNLVFVPDDEVLYKCQVCTTCGFWTYHTGDVDHGHCARCGKQYKYIGSSNE